MAITLFKVIQAFKVTDFGTNGKAVCDVKKLQKVSSSCGLKYISIS